MKKVSLLLLSLALILAAAIPMAAQTSVRLQGTVTDGSGAVLPNAKVTITSTLTGIKAETVSGAQGVYEFPSLQAGDYTITVEAAGFRKSVLTNLTLLAGTAITQDVKMAVGAVAESVTVEAAQAGVQTQEATTGRNITLADVNNLPQLARTPITLAIYQPGVQIASGDTSFSHVNGLRGGSNNSTLDGIAVNDSDVPRMGLALTAQNTDSIEEVRLITAGGKAEYGRSAGGPIELVTKSGTNKFHGNLFDYLRNTDMNANDFFNNLSGTARPVLIQNIFGGSVGGPIKKQKAFFFFNTQERRTTQGFITTRTVLTDLAKQGIFQYKNATTGALTQYSIINADPRKLGIDPTVASYLKLLPEPNNNSVGDGLNTAGYQFNAPAGGQENQITAKLDYNLTSTKHFFLRYSRETNFTFDALNSAQQTYPGQPSGTQGGERWGDAMGMDWTLSPSWINEFRYGHQSATVDFLRPGRLAGPEVIPNLYSDPYYTSFAQGRNSPVQEFTDNISHVRGLHTLKAGFNSRWTDQFGYNDSGIYPNINLGVSNGATVPTTVEPGAGAAAVIGSTALGTFNSLYNDLLGRVSSVTDTIYSNLSTFLPAGTPPVRNYLIREYAAFLQDDWRIKPNLTVNYGVRWELNKPPTEQDGLQGTLDQAANINKVSQISNLSVVKTSQWYKTDWNNFAPRFGFAWSPGKDGKTSIRGDYAIFFDRNFGATIATADGNTPGFTTGGQTIPGADYRISDGISALIPQATGSPVLTLPTLGTRSTSAVVFSPNLATGYTQNISLNVQREIYKNTILTVGYVGTRGIKLFMDEDNNQLHIYGDFLNSFNALAAYSDGGKLDGPAVPSSNTLVKIYGSTAAAIAGIGQTALTQGLVYSAANTVDTNKKAAYAAAGLTPFYLSNYPQYALLIDGTNDGRSYYNSLQVTLRRQVGALKITGNYTYSKSMDNWNAEGNGYTSSSVIDNFNLVNNRARSDYDQPQSFNYNAIYTLPFGKGARFGGNWNHFMDSMFGGWDVGSVGLWHSGTPMSFTSGPRHGSE